MLFRSVSFGALTCRWMMAYFSRRQLDPRIVQFILGTFLLSKLKLIAVYCVLELECDIKLDYWGHLTVMLRFSLFWYAYWLTYKVQSAAKYMKLPPDIIDRALLESYSFPLRQPDWWQRKDRVQQHCTWYLPGYSAVPSFQYAQLGINSNIIYVSLLLPYDPGGLSIWLNKIGGIPNSRLFIIGLRASRISRGEECNTPTMGCHSMGYNLGLRYKMGRGPRLCGFARSSISTRLVIGNRPC